ncbi:MAG: enoyl-CoA hydratase [Deltaproteobacteria bacterium HGW-Deltaproteobacteria-9]|nr:MAG: enoyl-CoA hydratase [Deltaproteobacteria bacterium HGW-Deltaproteobacteria-9]
MGSEDVLYRKEDGIGIITLNRPEKMNSVTLEMFSQIRALCNEIKTDNEVRAVILTGNGLAFSAGTDLSGRASDGDGASKRKEAPTDRILLTPSAFDRYSLWDFTAIPKPTICAINGVAVGIASEWPLHCDFRIAAESARWGQVFVMRGWVPDTGAGTYLLPRIVGLSKALELVFSARIIDAQEMLSIGLVSRVVADDQLMVAAMAMAKTVTRGAPLAVKMTKELMYRGLERGIEEHLYATSSAFSALSGTEDNKEGIKAFIEKREPHWQGR